MKNKKKSEQSLIKKLKKLYGRHKKTDNFHEISEEHAYGNGVISWSAMEYIKIQKGMIWFISAGIIVFLLIVYSFKQGSWTFAGAVLAAIFAYLAHMRQNPKKINITLTDMGIKIGKQKIPYSHMKAFWIVYHPPFIQTLNIRTTEAFLPDITIQLEDQNPVEIRKHLIKQIPEWEGKHENFMDSLARFLKL